MCLQRNPELFVIPQSARFFVLVCRGKPSESVWQLAFFVGARFFTLTQEVQPCRN